MAIKNGDFVLVVKPCPVEYNATSVPIGMKCYPAQYSTELVVRAKLANDIDNAAVHMIPMKYYQELGVKLYSEPYPNEVVVTTARDSVIAIAYIDEASNYYWYQQPYGTHLFEFRRLMSKSSRYILSLQSPIFRNPSLNVGSDMVGSSVPGRGYIYTYNPAFGDPQYHGVDMLMQNISRGPDLGMNDLSYIFDSLLLTYRAGLSPSNPLYSPKHVILSVDNSGSMYTDDLNYNSAYDNLKTRIQYTCPHSQIHETTYTNEQWLDIWYTQIENII